MQTIEVYRSEFIAHLESRIGTNEPKNLYEPMTYILGLGGKRLRPVLTLMSTEIFGKSYAEALDAALAIEVFHNFSLVHDDIMDRAPLRRGKRTVHEKWGVNTAILSGDVMLIKSYQLLENYNPQTFQDLVQLFSKTAIEVCEGQQHDIDFETRSNVTIEEYLEMIQYKTAVLVATALKMGGIIAGTSAENQGSIYNFGKNLGIAFQIQDDYLDAFGDPATFGKQVGGDIIENKKTFLFLTALEMSTKEQSRQLLDLYSGQSEDTTAKVEVVKSIFEESGAKERTLSEIGRFTQKAFECLQNISISADKKEFLKEFGQNLMHRQS